MAAPKLAIILLNYNTGPTTIECLNSVKKITWPSQPLIVVVDNASSDNSVKQIKEKFSEVTVVESSKNLGFAAGNNLGFTTARAMGANIIMLLNNDTKVNPELAENLYSSIKNKADIVAPKIYFYPGFEFHKDRYTKKDQGKVLWYAGGHIDWQNIYGIHHGVDEVDHGQFDREQEIEFATGCCFMASLSVLDKLNLFNPKYYLYLEDADFSVRAKRVGYKMVYQPKAILWHKNAESTGGSGSSLQDYYFTRNRLLFGFSYASPRTKLALYRESMKLFFLGPTWKRRGVIDFYFHRFGRGSYAAGN
ncbi:MAG: glycosyltransferase family 2 protein [Candidatus Chisholmbacteria bacterium]|nr:glycosyltransferase family 2 protein [Candidatus Chisholmbacteria bacterium]